LYTGPTEAQPARRLSASRWAVNHYKITKRHPVKIIYLLQSKNDDIINSKGLYMTQIRKVDCLRIYVDDLDKGLTFYKEKLGHKIIWRTTDAIGLQLPDQDAELVIQTRDKKTEVNLLVESVPEAIKEFKKAGANLVYGPIDIPIGQYAILKDPWDNELAILDSSKGLFITDKNGNIIGQES
jgi:lactoylglutathione lyase